MPAGATYEPIATSTLSSAQAGITFSSIPSTYTDLRLILFVNTSSTNGKGVVFRFNSDTATNYSMTNIYGDGTSVASNRSSNSDYGWMGYNTSIWTTQPALWIMDIFSYAGSTNKTVLCTGSADRSGAGAVERNVNLWRSTAAINTIRVSLYTDGSANMNAGTRATLYGIKNSA